MNDRRYLCLDFVNGPGRSRLKDALFEIFTAEARDRPVPRAALDVLRRELARAYRHPRLTAKPYALSWKTTGFVPEVVRSATELLTSEDLSRLRSCDADDCDWLFVDRSRNRSRRWCDMNTCGNRAKARRFYERWS